MILQLHKVAICAQKLHSLQVETHIWNHIRIFANTGGIKATFSLGALRHFSQNMEIMTHIYSLPPDKCKTRFLVSGNLYCSSPWLLDFPRLVNFYVLPPASVWRWVMRSLIRLRTLALRIISSSSRNCNFSSFYQRGTEVIPVWRRTNTHHPEIREVEPHWHIMLSQELSY